MRAKVTRLAPKPRRDGWRLSAHKARAASRHGRKKRLQPEAGRPGEERASKHILGPLPPAPHRAHWPRRDPLDGFLRLRGGDGSPAGHGTIWHPLAHCNPLAARRHVRKEEEKRACPTSHGRPSQRNSLSGGCLDSPSPASHPPASPASCDTGLESVCECFADTSALAEACLGKSPRAKNRVAAPSSLRSRLLTSTRLRPHVAAGLFGTGLGCAHPSLSATLLYFEQVLQLQRRLRPMRNRLPRACDALPGLPVLPESEPPEAFADRTAEYTLPVIDPKLSPNSRCHWCFVHHDTSRLPAPTDARTAGGQGNQRTTLPGVVALSSRSPGSRVQPPRARSPGELPVHATPVSTSKLNRVSRICSAPGRAISRSVCCGFRRSSSSYTALFGRSVTQSRQCSLHARVCGPSLAGKAKRHQPTAESGSLRDRLPSVCLPGAMGKATACPEHTLDMAEFPLPRLPG
ncbi:hypothetical protein ACCO45_010738 [Purpureocillium lilacinum]|uniref:Uncharacterized protein n=1 Tax=Purpureocillium lilacinum TaxID=33203 RepID=A0ACC4DIP0_PURLI